jgi:iron(III) transport system ATP-binding protein
VSFVDVQEISFTYCRHQPLTISQFSFAMDKGETVGILGPSGSGKSTLLRLIAGLETPAAGMITIAGQLVVDASTFVLPENRGVGMVFQDYGLFPHLTVTENVDFGLHRLPKVQRRQRVQEMFELVQLTGYEKRYPHELSGGQQQRVALARALAPEPSILLMDEPFSNLDASLKGSIRSELKEILDRAAITCLFVTHDQQDVEAICQRAVVMMG